MTGGPPPLPPGSGPGGSSRRSRRNPIRNPFQPPTPPPPVPTAPLDVLGAVPPDPLVAEVPPPPPPPSTAPEQRPRGFRRRRTTLPRGTRGWSRGIVWTLIGLTAFGGIYGSIARTDSTVSAAGQLRPLGGVTAVTVPFNAIVVRVLVRNGEMVRAGQPLLQIRDDALQEQIANIERMRSIWLKEVAVTAIQLGIPSPSLADPKARLELAAVQEEVLLRQQAAREELARSEINLNQQLSDLASLRNRYALNDQISGRMQGLIRQGAMAQLELDRQNERQEELAATIRRTEQEVASARRRVQESRLRRDQIPAADRKQLYAQFDNARQQLLEADGRLQDLQERLSLGSLKAPIAGRIDDLTVKAGEVATTATPAMRIVPQSTLQAELAVFNKDVGFLRLGQPVEVRVDSFPFTDYGALKGTLVRIAADVRQPDMLHPQPYFPVIVSLPANQLSKNGRTFDLRAGMAVSALIKLGQRPVISLILDRFGSFLESTSTIR